VLVVPARGWSDQSDQSDRCAGGVDSEVEDGRMRRWCGLITPRLGLRLWTCSAAETEGAFSTYRDVMSDAHTVSGRENSSVPPTDLAVSLDRLSRGVDCATNLAIEILRATQQAVGLARSKPQKLAASPSGSESFPEGNDCVLSLAEIRPDLHEPLRAAVVAVEAIWFDTPVQQYLIRAEPVHLDALDGRTVGRVSATCYVALAHAITATLLRTIAANGRADEWLDYMRYSAAVGDSIGDRWHAIAAHAACECATAITKLKPIDNKSRTTNNAPGARISQRDKSPQIR
jgi:hypothetical protein